METKKNNETHLKMAFKKKLDLELSKDFDRAFFQKLANEKMDTKRSFNLGQNFFETVSSFLSMGLVVFSCLLVINQFNHTPEDDYLDAYISLEKSIDDEIFGTGPATLTSLELNEI